MNQNILIIGATSGIAEAVARRYAEQGARLFLVARNNIKLETVSTDLAARGAGEVKTFVMEANDSDLLPQMLDSAWKVFGTIDVALVAHGTLPDQLRTETDIPYAIAEFRTNAESVIACLVGLAGRFETQGKGVIAVIGSVAGDRGRTSNYLYGAAKAAIDTYASGLRARLFKSGVHVLTIKPGFVATSMTAGLNLPARLTATPESVAQDIHRAIAKRKDVLYTPWFWILIMLIIRSLPAAIFKRMKF
ncbi:MAG: SDR family oxidoreductase [Sulfuricaulis sp.]|uniref:SDR family oxidoreductase n=1 Tax=Sulfuricaulis sp. TaxID=2003553 RepID=UPI003C3699A9